MTVTSLLSTTDSDESSPHLATALSAHVALWLERSVRSSRGRKNDPARFPIHVIEGEPTGAAMSLVVGPATQTRRLKRVDLLTFCRDGGLASLPALERRAILAFLVDATAELKPEPTDDGDDEAALASSLRILRDALRERLPICHIRRDDALGFHVDKLVATGDRSYFIKGWARAGSGPLARVTAVSPEGEHVELLPVAALPRPDVEAFYGSAAASRGDDGWASAFRLSRASRSSDGWVAELEDDSGRCVEVPCPAPLTDPDDALRALLDELDIPQPWSNALRRDHLAPALQTLQAWRESLVEIADVRQYGMPARDPVVTLVVPLYGRIDFVEHQLAQFVRDPEIVVADIIYVLDSPEMADQLRWAAERLFRLYGVSFRTVELNRNAGFAGASNIGAALGHGRFVLLLNSDVLPDQPGWLGQMVTFFDTTPGIGALGPKLLYEDESIQHAGMTFARPPATELWENLHPFKGMHRSLPAASTSRPMPCVTGACMLIDAAQYAELGGLRSVYVQGDYEDSDLCLRLWDKGLSTWYLADVELYHLEGQSYPSVERRRNAEFNRWLHTHHWNAQITELVASRDW